VEILKSTKKDFIEAIKNFHRVYYSVDDLMELHHAAEHLFNLAEIETTVCPTGRNQEIMEMASRGEAPPEDCVRAWDAATGGKF
jgi:hypothetical protein